MNPRTTGLLLLVGARPRRLRLLLRDQGRGGPRSRRSSARSACSADVEAADVSWIALRTSDGAERAPRAPRRRSGRSSRRSRSRPTRPATRMAEALAHGDERSHDRESAARRRVRPRRRPGQGRALRRRRQRARAALRQEHARRLERVRARRRGRRGAHGGELSRRRVHARARRAARQAHPLVRSGVDPHRRGELAGRPRGAHARGRWPRTRRRAGPQTRRTAAGR